MPLKEQDTSIIQRPLKSPACAIKCLFNEQTLPDCMWLRFYAKADEPICEDSNGSSIRVREWTWTAGQKRKGRVLEERGQEHDNDDEEVVADVERFWQQSSVDDDDLSNGKRNGPGRR